MGYYSGTAASLTALRTALLTHAVADGWTLTGDVLSKAGVYFQIQETATNITCLGCEDNAVANPAPAVVMIGRIYDVVGQPIREISYPCNYEVFGFGQELYLSVNYDVSLYQWMAFGKTTVPGVPGQGGWCGATVGSTVPNGAASGVYAPIAFAQTAIATFSTPISSALCTAQLFVSHDNATYNGTSWRNSWVNHGLDGHGWQYGATTSYPSVGLRAISQLLWQQPSAWNSEAALLPIRAWKERPSYKSSLIADLENARLIRLDNLTPGDILIVGSDKWRVLPWYQKNSAVRNGATVPADHTGTFGLAIRYEGP